MRLLRHIASFHLLVVVLLTFILGCGVESESSSTPALMSDYIIGHWTAVVDLDQQSDASPALHITKSSCITIMGTERATVNYEIVNETERVLEVSEWVPSREHNKSKATYTIENGRLFKEMFGSKVELVKNE